jgi:hypothetical protein
MGLGDVKAGFDKVGVGSRRELVAQVFAQHYRPRMRKLLANRFAQPTKAIPSN